MKYDAAVAGAGVAGTVFAARMARFGHRVVVCESAGRNEIGHDWWDTVELVSFDRIGLARPMPPEARVPFRFNLNINGKTLPTMAGMPPDMVNVDRKLLAARLIDMAIDAGVEFRFGWRVKEPIFESGSCVGFNGIDRDGNDNEIQAFVTVDATGLSGALRRHFDTRWGFEPTVPAGSTMVTWREARQDISGGGTSVLCMAGPDDEADPAAAAAYNFTSWISREPDGLADIFAGVLDGPGAPDPKQIAEIMITREGGVGETAIRGGAYCRIPLRRPFDGLVAPGFMLLGDAGCMANPVNGSGITNSIDAAIIAADTAHDAILSGSSDIESLWKYPCRFFGTHGELAFLDVLKQFVFTAPRRPLLSFMASGGLAGSAFWKMRDEFRIEKLPSGIRAATATKGAASLAGPLAAAFAKARTAELLYSAYPRKWNATAFSIWKKQMALVAASELRT